MGKLVETIERYDDNGVLVERNVTTHECHTVTMKSTNPVENDEDWDMDACDKCCDGDCGCDCDWETDLEDKLPFEVKALKNACKAAVITAGAVVLGKIVKRLCK